MNRESVMIEEPKRADAFQQCARRLVIEPTGREPAGEINRRRA